MDLENQDEIFKIKDCPNICDEKTKTLYRWVENNPLVENDILPFAKIHPLRFSSECLGWGISMYNTIDSIKEIFKAFSVKKQKKMIAVFSIVISKEIAHNHQSGNNENHYSVYPYKDIKLLNKFSHENI